MNLDLAAGEWRETAAELQAVGAYEESERCRVIAALLEEHGVRSLRELRELKPRSQAGDA